MRCRGSWNRIGEASSSSAAPMRLPARRRLFRHSARRCLTISARNADPSRHENFRAGGLVCTGSGAAPPSQLVNCNPTAR